MTRRRCKISIFSVLCESSWQIPPTPHLFFSMSMSLDVFHKCIDHYGVTPCSFSAFPHASDLQRILEHLILYLTENSTVLYVGSGLARSWSWISFFFGKVPRSNEKERCIDVCIDCRAGAGEGERGRKGGRAMKMCKMRGRSTEKEMVGRGSKRTLSVGFVHR